MIYDRRLTRPAGLALRALLRSVVSLRSAARWAGLRPADIGGGGAEAWEDLGGVNPAWWMIDAGYRPMGTTRRSGRRWVGRKFPVLGNWD